MNKNDIKVLEENGWSVDCESPFDISNDETGDQASGMAAQIILDSFRPKKKRKCHCGEPVDKTDLDSVYYSLCKEHALDAQK